MNALIAWLGGKSRLADQIVNKIPSHTCYVEVFCGGAHVFFTKRPSKVEVINDLNRDLVNLYRIAQNHLEEFIRQYKFMLVSRDQFDLYQKTDPITLTDIQRAVRFYYSLRTAFGAKVVGQSYGYSSTCPPRMNLLKVEEELSAAHIRLARVNIENVHYRVCIQKYDAPATFFYLDPPYYDCENDYGTGLFSKADFNELAEILSVIQGKFLMSINDVPAIRDIFKDFIIEEVATSYSIGESRGSVPELFITNYKYEDLSIEMFLDDGI